MIKTIRNKIVLIKEAIGVDIHFMEDGEMFISGVQLKTQNGNVIKVNTFDNIYSLEELKSKMPANIPLAISLNGKGILMRTVTEKVTDNLIGKIFPGTNPQHFVSVIHPLKEGELTVVYVTRRSLIEKVMKEITRLNIRVVSLTMGTSAVDVILPFITPSSVTIGVPTLLIDIEQRKINTVYTEGAESSNNNDFKVGGNTYKASQALALGNALRLLSRPADQLHSDIDLNEISRFQNDYTYYKLFSFVGWTVLISLLTLLLINFFVFNSHYNKNKELEAKDLLFNTQVESKAAASMEIDSLYNFFVRAGWNVATKHGYYIDRIAALVPSTVELTSIQSSPVNESNDSEGFVVKKDKIMVMGISINPTELEVFTRAIKNVPGVRLTELKNYLYKEDVNGAIFTIEVTY